MNRAALASMSLGLLLGSVGCAGATGDGAALPAKSATSAAPATEQLLAAGAVVTRPLDFRKGDAHYIGGIASGVVPASAERVLSAIHDATALREMLPHTKQVALVDANGQARRIELLQGSSLVDAKYTVELSPDGRPGELGFHLDPSRPHDIDDVYGYFKVERYDDTHSVVTIAAAVDIGSGLTEMLFGKKVQDVILSTPHKMRDYFARTEQAAAPALVAVNR